MKFSQMFSCHMIHSHTFIKSPSILVPRVYHYFLLRRSEQNSQGLTDISSVYAAIFEVLRCIFAYSILLNQIQIRICNMKFHQINFVTQGFSSNSLAKVENEKSFESHIQKSKTSILFYFDCYLT